LLEKVLSTYLNSLQSVINRGDAREESFYPCLANMLQSYAEESGSKKTAITILPKATDAGNPDFRVWDGKNHITGYIEAKAPHVYQLEPISVSEQLKRYLATFPNLILTNFYEFRLYQHGLLVNYATIARATNAINLGKTPPLEHAADMQELLSRYFSFSLPAITDPKSLANALAKRTRFLRDEILKYELIEEQRQGKKVLLNFYDSFKKLLINNLTLEQFADLYAQTLTYGIFAARTRSEGEFNRELIYKYIPKTLGVLKSIFKFISYEEPPKALEVLIDDIAEILFVTDIKKILHKFYVEGKGSDPIIHFYETFLSAYDPKLRESRGVYYTPEPVVRYIVRSIHSLLKSHFGKEDGLASFDVTLLDPAAGTLTFPAVAIRTAIDEYIEKYGDGNVHKLIKEHILPHFYAIELMMAPYTVGHLKIGYLLAEMGYEMSDDERFKLYLSNTLEPDVPAQLDTIYTHEITEECELANKVKHQDPILVIMGNPPYNNKSKNFNKWTEKLLKTDIDGALSYYKCDNAPLKYKKHNLQDDYVKFLRYAQWKIHKAGAGVVGMITNNSFLSNVSDCGMRESLMKTYNEIHIINLHGEVNDDSESSNNSVKDENVFDIKQGVSIALFIKKDNNVECAVYSHEHPGLRDDKFKWLNSNELKTTRTSLLNPQSPWYFFVDRNFSTIPQYFEWLSIDDIFISINTGIETARDHFAISTSKRELNNRVLQFIDPKKTTEDIALAFNLENSNTWSLEDARIYCMSDSDNLSHVKSILYRPFDERFVYYSSHVIHRRRISEMKHMMHKNIGFIVTSVNRQKSLGYFFVCNTLVDRHVLDNKEDSTKLIPLYIYTSETKKDKNNTTIFDDSDQREILKSPNIYVNVITKLSYQLNMAISPEMVFFYIYSVVHSNIYRNRYSQLLDIEFPRIPFPKEKIHFTQMVEYGKVLTELHLMTSPLLKNPIAKYQGKGNSDMVTEITYNPAQQTVKINPDKYFEGITQELWDYHIGGYQVLYKYLKDRKGKTLEDPIHYCRIVTALAKTMEIQREIDEVYAKIDAKG
jgi:predicted helicase